MWKSTDSLTTSTRVDRGDGKLCYGTIPARYVFVILSFFGFVLVYAYKVVLSVAIVSMVGIKKQDDNKTLTDVCFTRDFSTNSTTKEGDFSDWDNDKKALILGGFFYGYVVTQLPAGVLAQRFGGKWIYGCSLLITAILSLLGPIAAKQSYVLFLVTRIGQGLAEGVVFPCMSGMIAKWMPKMERSRGTTLIFTGAQIGTVITMPLTGALCESAWGWPSIFYVLGITGCVWFALWALLIHEDPESHPYISQQEYEYIIRDQEKSKGVKIIPWKQILTSLPVYALIITHFGQNWGFLTILTLLPTYFEKVFDLNIQKNSLYSSLPYLLQAIIGWIASIISDKLREKKVVGINVIRKTNNTIGFIGPAVCMCAVALVGCDQPWSITFFILAMGLNGCSFSGFNSTHVDMAPDFAGTLMGMTNSIGNIPGFIAPLVAAAFYKSGDTLTNWSHVFYLSAAVYVLTGIVYVLFASAEQQVWGKSKNEETIYINRDKKTNYKVDESNHF